MCKMIEPYEKLLRDPKTLEAFENYMRSFIKVCFEESQDLREKKES